MKVRAVYALFAIFSTGFFANARAQTGDYHPIENPPLTYALTEPIDELLEHDFVPWNYDPVKKQWGQSEINLMLKPEQNFTFIKAIEYRRAISRDHVYGVLSVQNPRIIRENPDDPNELFKEDHFYFYVFDQTAQFKPILTYLDKINEQSTVNPKASVTSFELKPYSSFTMELGGQMLDEVDRSITQREKNGVLKQEDVIRFNVVPVMSKQGEKVIRFVIDHGVVKNGQTLKKFDKKLFNTAYYEVTFDQFYAFITVLAHRFDFY